MIIESKLLELKNRYYAFFQNKLEKIVNNSLILSKIDEIILLFIGLTLFVSTFMQSDNIAVFAITVILLTFFKLHTKKGAKIVITNRILSYLLDKYSKLHTCCAEYTRFFKDSYLCFLLFLYIKLLSNKSKQDKIYTISALRTLLC